MYFERWAVAFVHDDVFSAKIGKYSRVVKRCDDGNKLTADLISMIGERAELEKAFSKMLKGWSKKWSDYVAKCKVTGEEDDDV